MTGARRGVLVRAIATLVLVCGALVCGALVCGAPRAHAHPLALGVLVVRESPDGALDTVFRFSGTEARTTGAEPELPSRCRPVGAAGERALREGGIERTARFDCGPGGLAGETIAVRGMEGTGVEIVVRIERADGSSIDALLDDGSREVSLASVRRADRARALREHVALGVEHIALGLDHLLFVLALLFLARTPRAIFATVTAFTLGHSATLALAALGAIRLPPAPVEACIALSILLVAREAHAERTSERPWAMAGAFGLLHGLGFAGALAERGLPEGAIVPALIGFNVGVELGQLAFVALVLALARAGRAWSLDPARPRAATLLAIGALAAYFFLDRCTLLGSSS